MPVGFTIHKSSNPYYSPKFPRLGPTAVFAVNCMNLEGSATLDIAVQHKNSDDTSWTTAGSFTQITATGRSTATVSSLKEEIRLQYTVGAAAGDFVHVFVCETAWEDA